MFALSFSFILCLLHFTSVVTVCLHMCPMIHRRLSSLLPPLFSISGGFVTSWGIRHPPNKSINLSTTPTHCSDSRLFSLNTPNECSRTPTEAAATVTEARWRQRCATFKEALARLPLHFLTNNEAAIWLRGKKEVCWKGQWASAGTAPEEAVGCYESRGVSEQVAGIWLPSVCQVTCTGSYWLGRL